MAKKTTTVTEFDEGGQVTKITETSEEFEQGPVWLDPRWYRGRFYVGGFSPYYGAITYTTKLTS